MRTPRSVEKKKNALVNELQACSMTELKRIAFIKGIHVSSDMRKKKKAMVRGIEEFVMCNQAKPSQPKTKSKPAKIARKESKKLAKTRAISKSHATKPLQRRSAPNGRTNDAKSKKKTKKEQKVNRSSRKTTVRSRRSKNPGEIKLGKQIVNGCLLKPSFDEITGLETKCPDFMTYDANSNCCTFSNEWMNKLRNEIDYDQNMMQLGNLINESSVSDNEKRFLKDYLRQQGQNFERNVTGVVAERFSLSASDRSTMYWVIDALKSFYKHIRDSLYFVMSSFSMLLKAMQRIYEGVKKTFKIDYAVDKLKKLLDSREKSAAIGTILGGLFGAGLVAATGPLSLGLAGVSVGMGTAGAVGAGVGALLGYYGISSLMSALINSSFVQKAKSYFMSQLMSPMGITMALDFFLETKRMVCARLGVLWSNKVLWLEYCAKNNYNVVKQISEDFKQNVNKSIDCYMLTSLFKETGQKGIKMMRQGTQLSTEIMLDQSKGMMNYTLKGAANLAKTATGGLVDLTEDLKTDTDTEKKALNPIFDCIEMALNFALGHTFIGINLEETWQKLQTLFNYEDCVFAYRKERVRLLHQNMLRTADKSLNDAVRNGFAELYLGGKLQKLDGVIDVRKLLVNHVGSQPTTLTLTQKLAGAMKRHIRKQYAKEELQARRAYRMGTVSNSLRKGHLITAASEASKAAFHDPYAQYDTVGDNYKPIEGQMIESSADTVKNAGIATSILSAITGLAATTKASVAAVASATATTAAATGGTATATTAAATGGTAAAVGTTGAFTIGGFAMVFAAVAAVLLITASGLYYMYQSIVVEHFDDYKTKPLDEMLTININKIRPRITQILKMDIDTIVNLMMREANQNQLVLNGSVSASKIPKFSIKFTNKPGADKAKAVFVGNHHRAAFTNSVLAKENVLLALEKRYKKFIDAYSDLETNKETLELKKHKLGEINEMRAHVLALKSIGTDTTVFQAKLYDAQLDPTMDEEHIQYGFEPTSVKTKA